MKYFVNVLGVSLCLLLFVIGCSKESMVMNMEEMMEIDSSLYWTDCMVDIVLDFETYINNDSISVNDDYPLESVGFMEINDSKYYWIVTAWEDETEYVYDETCSIFCSKKGWTSWDDSCLPEFKDSLWMTIY